MTTRELQQHVVSKVPAVTLGFWIIKIAATTLGETGGDAVTMSWLGEATPGASGMGYLVGTGLFAVIFAGAVWAQMRATRSAPGFTGSPSSPAPRSAPRWRTT